RSGYCHRRPVCFRVPPQTGRHRERPDLARSRQHQWDVREWPTCHRPSRAAAGRRRAGGQDREGATAKDRLARASHTGRVRSNNEDAVYPPTSGAGDDSTLFIVADGMGGHVAGEVASRIAVDTAVDIVGGPTQRVIGANHALLLEVAEKPELAGMGTT